MSKPAIQSGLAVGALTYGSKGLNDLKDPVPSSRGGHVGDLIGQLDQHFDAPHIDAPATPLDPIPIDALENNIQSVSRIAGPVMLVVVTIAVFGAAFLYFTS